MNNAIRFLLGVIVLVSFSNPVISEIASNPSSKPANLKMTPEECYQEGQRLDDKKEYKKAFELFRQSAQQEYIDAQYSLGIYYAKGLGVEKNLVEAVKWFRKAAEQGNVRAQFNLGVCYAFGLGIEKNLVEAVKWYRKAAEQGEPVAQYFLGVCYANGNGVEKNLVEAVKWYRKAAEQGVADAQFDLGICYANSFGVEKNLSEAVKWWQKAAEQGYAQAQYNLAYSYNQGEGIEKDSVEAVKWYRKAAEQGNADAQSNLGFCYARGNGVEKNFVEAVKWYHKAAEQGNARAQSNLGLCYAKGNGVEKNFVEAVKWFRKAAEQGHASAQSNLGVSYALGQGVIEDWVEAYKWILLAGASGEDVSKIKDFLLEKMTREDVVEAQRRAKEFQAALEQKNNSKSANEAMDSSTKEDAEKILGTGSGFVVGQKGLIITAWHVIEGADKIVVEYQGQLYPAECLTGDKGLDIAVLQVKHEFSSCLKMVSSESAAVSEKVFTVGFPNIGIQGAEPKYTEGVISAKSGVGGLMKYFQISVPIQPGNSGGALVNTKGEVVGMVTAKLNELYTLGKTGSIPQNVNYALKSSFILPYLENFMEEMKQAQYQGDEERTSKDVVKQAIDAAVLIVSYQKK